MTEILFNGNLFHITRILGLAAIAFIVAMAWTPLLTHYLFKYRLGKQIRAEGAPIFNELHQKKEGTPTMGGILIWLTVLILAILFWVLGKIEPALFSKFNFLTRSETLLPLGCLVACALIGLGDDLLGIYKIGPKGGGLTIKYRLLIYTLIAIFGAWWFYYKLEWSLVHVPFIGDFYIGWWYIPVFIFVIVATAFSVNETDGLDGLAGGVLLTSFAAYAAIAYSQGKMDLAAFCGLIIGALLAFLWFNIHPARFFMGDTGAMSLGVTLGIIAMLTNAFLFLPFIGFILVLESGSVIVQLISKKIKGKKIFLSTPIHHHFEAKGWPETKVTERFWIISSITAAIGLILALMEKII